PPKRRHLDRSTAEWRDPRIRNCGCLPSSHPQTLVILSAAKNPRILPAAPPTLPIASGSSNCGWPSEVTPGAGCARSRFCQAIDQKRQRRDLILAWGNAPGQDPPTRPSAEGATYSHSPAMVPELSTPAV